MLNVRGRNQQIIKTIKAGTPISLAATKYRLSRQRVYQILLEEGITTFDIKKKDPDIFKKKIKNYCRECGSLFITHYAPRGFCNREHYRKFMSKQFKK